MTNDKYVLTNDEALNDVQTLYVLVSSIWVEGKIRPINENGCIWDKCSVCSQDRQRTDPLYDLMDKYCYGWYIAETKTASEQVTELKDFMIYILSNIGKSVCCKRSEEEEIPYCV